MAPVLSNARAVVTHDAVEPRRGSRENTPRNQALTAYSGCFFPSSNGSKLKLKPSKSVSEPSAVRAKNSGESSRPGAEMPQAPRSSRGAQGPWMSPLGPSPRPLAGRGLSRLRREAKTGVFGKQSPQGREGDVTGARRVTVCSETPQPCAPLTENHHLFRTAAANPAGLGSPASEGF